MSFNLHWVEYWHDIRAMKIKKTAAAFNADGVPRTCKKCGTVQAHAIQS